MFMIKRLRLLAVSAAVALLGMTHAAEPLPGNYDVTFAPPLGFMASGFSAPLPTDSKVAVALQPDGKYVVATTCGVAFTDFCVFRLTTTGGFDATFVGPDPAQPGNGKVVLPMGAGNSGATAALIQRDGRIVVAGFCDTASGREFCAARLNVDGSLDATFDGPDPAQPGNGRVVLKHPATALPDRWLAAAALQDDQRIVLAGYCYQAQGSVVQAQFCLARLNTDGSLDTDFDGPDTRAPGNGQITVRMGTDNNFATSVAVTDEAIVVAGYCQSESLVPSMCVARLNVDGSFDANFTGNVGRPGESQFRIDGMGASARSLLVQADGRIVLAGDCTVGNWLQICAARLRTDGTLDATFGPRGNGTLQVTTDFINASMTSVALQEDGKIVMAGTCWRPQDSRVCLMRLHGDGYGDSTFDGPAGDGNGLVKLPQQTGADRSGGMVLLKDGRVLLAGSCRGADSDLLCAERLIGGPFAALRCSPDVDGDGMVTPFSDLLMLTRIARGARGDAVTSAIIFPPGATRRGWQAVQQYLASQCGLPLAP